MNARASHGLLGALGVAALLAYGCASGPKVYTHAAPEFAPSAYHTYGFLKSTNETGYSTPLMQYIEAAVARELQSRGYQPAEQPDLLVNFHVASKDKVQVTPTSSTYYRWRRSYDWHDAGYARSFTEGTLNIDLVDRARKQLVWEGVAVGRVTDQKLKNPQPAVDGAVAAIFARFPSPQAASASP